MEKRIVFFCVVVTIFAIIGGCVVGQTIFNFVNKTNSISTVNASVIQETFHLGDAIYSDNSGNFGSSHTFTYAGYDGTNIIIGCYLGTIGGMSNMYIFDPNSGSQTFWIENRQFTVVDMNTRQGWITLSWGV